MDINNNTELEYLDLNTNVLTKNDVLNNVDSSSNKVVTSKGIFDAITQNMNQLAEYVNENYGKKITSLSIDLSDISDSVSTISGKVDVVDSIVKNTIKNVIIDISANISKLQNNVSSLLSDMYVLTSTTLTSIAEDVKILTNDIYVNGVKSDISSISNYISGKVEVDIQRISVELSNFQRIDNNIDCLSSNMTKYVDASIACTNNKIDKTNNDVLKLSTTIYDDDGIISNISNLNDRNALLTKSIYSKNGLSATLTEANKKIVDLEDALYSYDDGLSNKVHVLQEDVINVKAKTLSIDNDLKTLDATLTPKVDNTIIRCNAIEKEIYEFEDKCKDEFNKLDAKTRENSLSILNVRSDLRTISSDLNAKIKTNSYHIDDLQRRIAIDYSNLDKKIDDNKDHFDLIQLSNEHKINAISSDVRENSYKIRKLNDYVVDEDQILSNAIDVAKTNTIKLENDVSNISVQLQSNIANVKSLVMAVDRKTDNIKTDLSYDIDMANKSIANVRYDVNKISGYVDDRLVTYEKQIDYIYVSTIKNSDDIIKLSSQISGITSGIREQVSANTENISALSSSFNTISSQMTEQIETNTENISALSSSFNTISSQMTEQIETNTENISKLCTDVDKKLYASDFSKTLSAYLLVVSEIPSEEEQRKHPDVFYFVIGK